MGSDDRSLAQIDGFEHITVPYQTRALFPGCVPEREVFVNIVSRQELSAHKKCRQALEHFGSASAQMVKKLCQRNVFRAGQTIRYFFGQKAAQKISKTVNCRPLKVVGRRAL